MLSDRSGVDLVVFRMSTYESGVNDPEVVVNGHYQPIPVAFDIKYCSIAWKNAGVSIRLFDLAGAFPCRLLRVVIQGFERYS